MKRSNQRAGLILAVGLSAVLAGCFGDSPESLIASAKSHIAKNDSKAAVIQLKNALQKNASSAEARFLLGKLLLDGGDVNGAAIELGKAKELNYDSQQLTPLLARILLLQGQPEKVLAEYAQTALSDPKQAADLKLTLAGAYLATGKTDKGRESLDAALKADPSSSQAQLLDVRLRASQGRVEEALATLDAVLTKKPEFSQGWQLKGDLLGGGLNRPEEALSAYREALKHDPKSIGALSGIFLLSLSKADNEAAQDALKKMQAIAPNLPQVRYFATRLALQRNDLAAANEQAQALLKLTPKNPNALQIAGAVAYRRNELVQAETYLRQALQAAPNSLPAKLTLARTYLRSGEPKKAQATLHDLVEGKEPNPQALSILAEAALQQGDAKLAETYFAQAVKLNPKDSRSRTALAMANIGKGQSEQGLEELRAIAVSDESVLADMALISTLVRKKDFDQALKAVDAVERKQAGQPTAAALRGRIELLRGNTAKAREGFDAALKVSPAYMPALASLAALDIAAKKPEDAVRRFEAVIDKAPQNVQAQMALIGLRKDMGAKPEELLERLSKAIKQNPQAPQLRLAQIQLKLEQKDVKQALASAQDAVAAVPDNVDILSALSQAQAAAGDFNQALIAANKAVSLQPDSATPLVRLSELQFSRKDYDGAAQTLRRVIALKPDVQQPYGMLITVLREAGKPTEVRAVLRTMKAQFPKSAAPFTLEGDFEYADKKWDAAVQAYRKGLDIENDSALAMKIHMALLSSGKADEAKKHEAQWIARNPKDPAFVFYLADQALAQGDTTAALARYQTVLKLQPNHPVAANNTAWLLHKAGKPGALELAQRANELRPKSPAFMDTLAEILATSGQMDKALALQREAVTLAPEFHPHRLHLAELYVRAGKKAEAAEELKQLAALGDKFPRQEEVKRLQAKL